MIIGKAEAARLAQEGKAIFDRPGRHRVQSKPPKKTAHSIRLLQSMHDSIRGMAEKDDSKNTALLESIEALLKQLIALYSKEPPVNVSKKDAAAEAPKNNWKFTVQRDNKGRISSIEAEPID